ncbi:MAG: hypothetical protein QOG57_561, partial [Pseudonocardiales bacterium]|nr:hypothetical protein [Pseudonocardiales bacterium]
MTAGFAGPYAAGPPAGALDVTRPPLARFGPAELARIVVVCAVLASCLLTAGLRWLLDLARRWRGDRLPHTPGRTGPAAQTWPEAQTGPEAPTWPEAQTWPEART